MPICNIQLKAEKPSRLPFPDENDHSLGAELKRQRLALEWTQQDVADYIGIHKDSYQNYEWNEQTPHIRFRKKVNEFLGFNYWDDGSRSLSNMVLLYRINYGLTIRELAKLINVSTRTIERIENMEKGVSSEMRDKIFSLLNSKV